MGVVYAGFIVVIGGFHPEGKGVAVAGAAGLGANFPVGQQVVLTVLFGPCGELHAVHAAGIGYGAGDSVAGGIHIRDLGVGNGGTGLIRSNRYLGGVLIRRVAVRRFAVLVGVLLVNGIERYIDFTGLIGRDVQCKAVIGAAVKCIVQTLIVVLVGDDLMTLVVDIDVHRHLCIGGVRVKSPALYINVILPALHHVHAQIGEVVGATLYIGVGQIILRVYDGAAITNFKMKMRAGSIASDTGFCENRSLFYMITNRNFKTAGFEVTVIGFDTVSVIDHNVVCVAAVTTGFCLIGGAVGSKGAAVVVSGAVRTSTAPIKCGNNSTRFGSNNCGTNRSFEIGTSMSTITVNTICDIGINGKGVFSAIRKSHRRQRRKYSEQHGER